jgi:MOSC domain-containing protein YiiM
MQRTFLARIAAASHVTRWTEITMSATVIAVSRSPTHSFSKANELGIVLVAGQGVDGDAHAGETVKHRSRVARDPNQPNLRQVHLIHSELFEELRTEGYTVAPGQLGENVTTRGLDLLGLPVGTRLHLGDAVVEVTGLRNPCTQLDRLAAGLMQAVLGRDANGQLVRKAGVMAVVLVGGAVCPGDRIGVALPARPHAALEPV